MLCAQKGFRVGLYYSLIDWHHNDFPKYADLNHPMRGNKAYEAETIHLNRYLAHMHRQIEELCTNYGKIDLLWFDYSYDDLRGGDSQAEMRALYKMRKQIVCSCA